MAADTTHNPKNEIILSHPLFGRVLTLRTLNQLLFLFDGFGNTNYSNHRMAQYVMDERMKHGLDNTEIEVQSYLYNHITKKDPSLHLQIKKGGVVLILFI